MSRACTFCSCTILQVMTPHLIFYFFKYAGESRLKNCIGLEKILIEIKEGVKAIWRGHTKKLCNASPVEEYF